jgi:hypothetical protein
MSLILDALKKLDREKKLSRRGGTTHIAAEILRPDMPRPGKRMVFYFAAASSAAVVAAAITYAVIGGHGLPAKSLHPAPMHPPIPTQQVTPAPPQAESPMKPSPPPPMTPSKPVQQVAPAPSSESGALAKL